MTGAWKDKPNEGFDLVREVAVAWRTVELADTQRHRARTGRVNSRGQSSAKPFPGVPAGGAVDKASTAVVTCFKCRKPDHLSRSCPLHTFPSKVSSPTAGERGNGGHGSSTGRGRPPPPAQQQRPQPQRQQQQRQPQHSPQQQRRFSGHQPGSTPSSGAGKGHGGASSTVFHQRHVGGCAVFSGDTEPAGAGRVTESLPPHPTPSSTTAPASVNAPAADGPGESGPYVPAFRGVLPGGMSGFSAEGVAVDEREKSCQVSLSVPGAAVMAVVDAVAYSTRGLVSRPCLLGLRTSCKRHFLMFKLWGHGTPGEAKGGGWPCARGSGENMPGAGCSAHQLGFGHHGSVFFCTHAGRRRCCHSRKSNFEAVGHRCLTVWGRARGNGPPSPVSTPQRTSNAAASLLVSTLCSSSRAGRQRSRMRPWSAWWRGGRTST